MKSVFGQTVARPNPMPKYQLIRSDLQREIGEGLKDRGGRLPSQRELMRRYGVTQATILRALDGLVHEGLIVREHGRGTFVRRLVTTNAPHLPSHSILVTVGAESTLSHPCWAAVVQGAAHECEGAGLRLSTLVTAGGHGGEILDRVRRHGLAGILAVEPIPAAVQERLMAERVPVVGVVAWMPPVAPTTAHVGFAFIQTVATALRHFIELGHERIAILRSGVPDVRPDDSAVLPARYSFGRACRETCEAHGVRYHPEYMVSAGSIDFVNGQRRVDAEAGMRGMATLLAMDPRPSAVYITDDFLAFGALRELARQGVKVPQDISVISFANAGVAAMFPFPVTTTEFDGRNAGARAVQVLRDLIAQEPSVRREFELPAEFVDRGSCRRIQV